MASFADNYWMMGLSTGEKPKNIVRQRPLMAAYIAVMGAIPAACPVLGDHAHKNAMPEQTQIVAAPATIPAPTTIPVPVVR